MNWSYLAGIIDGDGWIGFSNGYPIISIANNDKKMLKAVQKWIRGGNIYDTKVNKCFQLVIRKKPLLYDVLIRVRYQLIVKRNQADKLIKFIRYWCKKNNYTVQDLEDELKGKYK